LNLPAMGLPKQNVVSAPTPPPRKRLRLMKDFDQQNSATPEKTAQPPRPKSNAVPASKPQEPKRSFEPGPRKEEVRADLCMARVWGDGYGRQCPRHPRSGTQLCGLHKEGLLAHGRVDEPVPPAKLKQMEEAVMKSRGQPKVSESRSPPVASSTAVTRGGAAMQESEIDMSGSNFTWLSDGEEEPAMRPFMRTVGKRSRRRHHRVEYLSGHEVSFVLEVGDVVRAFRGKGGLVCGEICELVEDGQRKFMVLRRMYEAAELRKGSARPTLSEKELVASEKCEELPLSSLAGRPLRVLSQKAYTKEADEEDINIQATGCMFCRRLLGEGDVLWELDWDKDREKKREECLRAYRGLEKKEAQGKLPDGPQGIFFMALSALRPFASEGMLPCRESEQASVMEFLKSSLRVHIKKEVLYVSGMPGTGKTASVLDAAKRLEKARSSSSNSNTPIKFAYVNAMCLSTPSAVFAEIQRKVLGQAQKRKRGPGPGGDGEEALRQALTQAGGEVVILVIDEVDALLTQGQTVLYRLFDWMSQPNARLVVVAIANTMDLPERLLPRVSSRLGIRRVNFEAYNRDQLHTILADRLRAGGAEAAIRDDALKLCAARVAAAGGDARKALQVCQAAVQRAIDATAINGKEPEAVTAAQMDKAEAELLQRNPVAVGIMNLNLKPRCFLLGMVLELRKQNAYALPPKTVTRRYEAIMRILQQRDEGAGKATQPVSSERCAWESLEYQRRLEDCCIIAQYALEQKEDGEGAAMGLGFVSSIDVSEAATALSVAPGDELAKELLDLQPPCPYRRLS